MTSHSHSPAPLNTSLPNKRQLLRLTLSDRGVRRVLALAFVAFVVLTAASVALLLATASSLHLSRYLPHWALLLAAFAIALGFVGGKLIGDAVRGVREGWGSAKRYYAASASASR